MMMLPMVIQFQLHDCPGNYDAFLWIFSVFALVQFFDKDYVSSLVLPRRTDLPGMGGRAPIFSEASGAALCVLVNLFGIFLVSLLLAATSKLIYAP